MFYIRDIRGSLGSHAATISKLPSFSISRNSSQEPEPQKQSEFPFGRGCWRHSEILCGDSPA